MLVLSVLRSPLHDTSGMSRLAMLTFICLCLSMVLCDTSDDIHRSWFSTYGQPNFARSPSEGTDRGEVTKFQCSRSCARDSVCKAFQFKSTIPPLGRCVVFDEYTLRKNMIGQPGTKYYEKRDCALDLPIDAAILHRSDFSNSMFSGLYVRTYRFTIANNVITGVTRLGHNLISDVYPGYMESVDAGFEMPGLSPSRTILLKGTQEFCYERSSNTLLTFTQCANTDYLSTFFSQTTKDHVDTIAVYDVNKKELHVTVDDVVYHLRYNNVLRKFEVLGSFGVLETTPSNPWYNAFPGMTAMFGLTSRSFYVFEGPKYIRYDIVTKQITNSPRIVCDD